MTGVQTCALPIWSPGVGNGNPLQNSCLDISMHRGAWRATVHGVTKTCMQLSNWAIYTQREEEKVLRKERWLDMEYALKFSSFMLVSGMRYPLTGVVVWIQVRRWAFRRQWLLLSLTLALSTTNKAGPEAEPVFKCDESCQWPTVLPRNDLSCVCTMTCAHRSFLRTDPGELGIHS